jgi:hypothetical protein
MKMHGKEVRGVNRDVLVIPRMDGDLVFVAEAIQDWTEFETLCPVPSVPQKMIKGGKMVADPEAKEYQEKMLVWAQRKTNYMVLKSLTPTEGLEWETVQMQNPETWGNWRKELEESGFIENEVVKLLQLCSNVNCITEDMMARARENFLRSARQVSL